MPTVETGEGLFVGLQIRETGDLTRFLDGIPPRVGEALPEDRILLDLVCPTELAFEGLARKERRDLGNSQRRILRSLGQVIGSDIEVSESELLPNGSDLELVVDPSDEIRAARESLEELVARATGNFLPSIREWRLKVADKKNGGEVPELYLDPPRVLRVGGLVVGFGSHTQARSPSRRSAQKQRVVRHSHRQPQPVVW